VKQQEERGGSVVDGYFTQSMIKSKLGRIGEAVEAYRKGFEFVSIGFLDRNTPYVGPYWDEGVWTEIARRDAALLLNERGLMDDDQFHLKLSQEITK